MLFFFAITNLTVIIVSINQFKKIINPCSLYALIWSVDILLFYMKGFPYEDLSTWTVIIILLFEVALCTGIMIGEKYTFVFNKHSATKKKLQYEDPKAQAITDKFILIFYYFEVYMNLLYSLFL